MILDLAHLSPGIELYVSLEVTRDEYDMPMGGVVVATFDQRDQDTGEIVRYFRCIDPARPGDHRWALPLVREGDVDPWTIRPASRQKLTNCILRLCEWVKWGTRSPRHARQPPNGVLSPERVEWAGWIGVLAHELGALR